MEGVHPRREAARLISKLRWFVLATIEQDGSPTLSYVPFAVVDGAFGMVASRLAAHTANLLARRPASVILVDDDGPAVEQPDAYARSRFSIGVTASPRVRGSFEADAIWSALAARRGATVGIVRTLPDFEAFALRPSGGRLVLGFASAHDLDVAAIIDEIGASEQ